MRDLPESKKFLVAFSFAGEQQELVHSIAKAVEKELGLSTVFLDAWYEYFIAGHDGDLKLQRIYEEDCKLAVICVSENYGNKPWTKAEHAAIRARNMRAEQSIDGREKYGVLPIRVGDGDVPGIPFTTIVPDVRQKSIDDTAKLIIQRLKLICPEVYSLADFRRLRIRGQAYNQH